MAFLHEQRKPCLIGATDGIEPSDLSAWFGERREFVGNVLLQLPVGEIVRYQQIDFAASIAIFDEGYRAAFRPAADGPHDADHELSIDVQAHD